MMESSQSFVFAAGSGHKPPDDKQPKVSFRDKVMGQNTTKAPRPLIDLYKENLAKLEYQDGNHLRPMVHIADKVFEGLEDPWKDALVVKLLGKSLGFHTMKDRLQCLWKLTGGFEIMDIGNGFFMVEFDLEADRSTVVEGGPWMIFDHYLTVQCWTPEFASPTAKIDKTMVWIRFPGLNVCYYDESILLALATAVGTPVKVDSNTLNVRRGRFARVCVQIDLNKPVVGKVWMRNFWYQVEYEGLHRICSTCGCYGHLTRQCTVKATPENYKTPEKNKTPVNTTATTTTTADVNVAPNTGSVAEIVGTTVTNINQDKGEDHGDWLVVKRKNRKPPNNKSINLGKDINVKSSILVKENPASYKKKKEYPTKKLTHDKMKEKSINNIDFDPNKSKTTRKPRVGPIVSMQPNDPNISHKRHRTSEANFHSTSQHANQDNMCMKQNSNSYEVGFGIKSTINCEATSPNGIVLLEESGNIDKLPKHVQHTSAILDQRNIDEVPETPPDKMAT
jgi:hypothetical protein